VAVDVVVCIEPHVPIVAEASVVLVFVVFRVVGTIITTTCQPLCFSRHVLIAS
jgi:hypothetical protein